MFRVILLEHELVDDVLRFICPVLLGTGKRFFAEVAPPRSFELVGAVATSSGNVLNTYHAVGPSTGIKT
jgi:dihydrofolate reductase